MKKLDKIKEYIKNRFSKDKSFEYLYNRGIDFYDRQEYENAIKFFKLATEQIEAKPPAYYNLALSHQHLKEYDKAILVYQKFLILCPEDYDGLYNIALTYYIKEDYEKAVEFFEKCVKVRTEEDGVKALTLAYLNLNKLQEALDFAENLLQIPDRGTKLYFEIAKTFENKHCLNKDFTYIDKAIEMYIKIVEKEPENFNVYLAISICYAKKGEWENSVEFCKKAMQINPKSYEANNQMGLVYYCCNELKEAIKYYETALKIKPEDYKIYSNLGYAYEKVGDYDQAIKLFTQLVRKFPQVPARDEIKNHLRILKTL